MNTQINSYDTITQTQTRTDKGNWNNISAPAKIFTSSDKVPIRQRSQYFVSIQLNEGNYLINL